MHTTACIICECADRGFFKKEDIALIERTLTVDYETDAVIRCPFLCSKRIGLKLLAFLTKAFDRILVVGCYARAQKWLFQDIAKKNKLVFIPL
ncbi:MAG: hypothetical protein AB1485_08720, partial [Candidatus Thermoplasmatota archaeon]